MMIYVVDLFQSDPDASKNADSSEPLDGSASGDMFLRIILNTAGLGRYSMSAPTFPQCLVGIWEPGEKIYGVQGSVYLDNKKDKQYFNLELFFPFAAYDGNHKVGEKGKGLFKDPPFQVSKKTLFWKIADIRSV